MSSFCLCSDMITAEYLYSYAALSLCTIIVRNRESCKITVRFAMHRILADCTNSRGMSRACLKKAFRELRVPVCGRFYPNEGGVAGYGNRMRAKYTAKWGLQIAEMIFQTRSRISWIAIRPRYPVLLHFWHPIPRFTLRISAPIRIRSRSVVSTSFSPKSPR